jgi:hypothetical protein
MKRTRLVPLLVLGALLAACASIRVVSGTAQGGEIALLGPREGAMAKARDEMARTCGAANAYEIVEEGEIGFGSDAGANQDPKEWHIHYECKTADAAQSRDTHVIVVRF